MGIFGNDCKVCNGISRKKCGFCGQKLPSKSQMTDDQLDRLEAYHRGIARKCKHCHGISKNVCFMCGYKPPQKNHMTDAEVAEFENWVEKVEYLQVMFYKIRKFRTWNTGSASLNQELYEMMGDFRAGLPFPRKQDMKFNWNDKEVFVSRRSYDNGRLAVVIESGEGEVLAHLSANVPHQPMGDREFAVKNYSENAELAAAAGASGIFIDTGRVVQSGYVTMPIWRL